MGHVDEMMGEMRLEVIYVEWCVVHSKLAS